MSDKVAILAYLLENSAVAKELNEDEPVTLEVLLAKYDDFDKTIARIGVLARLSKDKFKPSNSVIHRKYPYDAIADATIEDLVKLSEIAEYLYLTDNTLDKLRKVIKYGIGINAIVQLDPKEGRFDLNSFDSWAKYGDIAGMEWLLSLGYDPLHTHLYAILENGELEALEWLHLRGCKFDSSIYYDRAAVNEHYECMDWLYKIGCPVSWPTVCDRFSLNILKWFHNHGAKCEYYAFLWIACKGHIDCLEWLCSVGVPTAIFGSKDYDLGYLEQNKCNSDRLRCLKLLHSHGIKFNRRACERAENFGWTEGAAWLREVITN